METQKALIQMTNAQLRQEIAERQRIEDALCEGYADLALQTLETASTETITDQISKIKTSTEAVFALLENLLTWSRLQRGAMEYQPEPLSLEAIVAEICELFRAQAEHKQIELRQQIPPTAAVWADANMLSAVIRNLLSNALKFTHPGGWIDITAQPRAAGIEMAIADTGIGIPEDVLPNLFRIDTKTTTIGTAGERGTGLGLPLCQDLIEKTIRVNSTPGQGATFVVTLPYPQAALQTSAIAAALPEDRASLADAADASGTPPQRSRPSMSRDMLVLALARLPQAWRTELCHAIEACEIAAVMNIIAQIRQHDERLAEALTTFVQQYQFDILQEVCENINA